MPPGARFIPAGRNFRKAWGLDTVFAVPPVPEPVVRGARVVGAAAGLVGNGLEATAAVGLALEPEPASKVGAVGLGLLAADGAQANIRTIVSGGEPTPTVLARGVAGAARYVTDEATAQVVGTVVDAGAHMGATAYSASKIPLFTWGTKAAGPAPAAEAGAAAAEGAAPNTARLTTRAEEIHSALDPIAAKQRTTAVLETTGGDIIGSGGRDLSRKQLGLLKEGEIAAKLPGEHAEMTALQEAAARGLKPKAISTTRDFCPACRKALEDAGATITGPRTAIWK